MNKKTTRRVRVKLDYVVEYDRELDVCPITANELAGIHGQELCNALKNVYALRPGVKRLGMTITMLQLDYRKAKP